MRRELVQRSWIDLWSTALFWAPAAKRATSVFEQIKAAQQAWVSFEHVTSGKQADAPGYASYDPQYHAGPAWKEHWSTNYPRDESKRSGARD